MDMAVAISRTLREQEEPARLPALWATAAAAAVVLGGTAATLGASAATGEPTANALVRGGMVAVPMGVALYAAKAQHHERFARLLYATGVVAFLTTLAESRNSDLYTAGRLAGWAIEVLIAAVVLAYPTGRLETRTDRRLVAAMALAASLLFLPTAFLVERFPLPSPWTSCAAGQKCPASSLYWLQAQPGFADALRAGGTVCVLAIMVAIAVRLHQRITTGTPAVRRALVPVLVVGIARSLLIGIGLLAREVDDTGPVAQTVAWTLALSTPAIALAFVAGLVQTRLSAERALRRFASFLQALPDAAAVRRALGETVGDPTAEIAFPDGTGMNRWVDETGQAITLPLADDRLRAVYVVRDGATTVAAIIHDADNPIEQELSDAAASLASVALDNQRLARRAQAADRAVRRSRARIAALADAERRRIERDLHDGAQQRLVALRIELGLLDDLAQRHPEQLTGRLHELEDDVEAALDELRALAHGVCPPVLTDLGIVEALQAAAQRCRAPVAVRAAGVGRYAPEVETAIYFCVLEALQNIDKHARGARHASVELDGRDRHLLTFAVRDDGPGAEPAALQGGAGMVNMGDRIQAVGGHLRVASAPGEGTEVSGSVPVLRSVAQRPVAPVHGSATDLEAP
jgi:signal transduction histidine kinase